MGIRCVLGMLLLAAGCSGRAGPQAPPEPEAPALADLGARLWRYARETPPARFTLESRLATERLACPGPHLLCAERRPLLDADLKVSGVFGKLSVHGDCELQSIERLEGNHQCGGTLEGQVVTLREDGESLRLRFAGNIPFRELGFETEPFSLGRIDPIAAGFEAEAGSGNRSSETAHLALLTEPVEQRAEAQGFGTPAAARAELAEAGVDSRTMPVEMATRLARELREARISSLRLPPPLREELAGDIVQRVLHGDPGSRLAPEQRAAPEEAEGGEGSLRWVVARPGTGLPADSGEVVRLAYAAWDEEGRLAGDAIGRVALGQLGAEWRALVSAMKSGETRRVFLPPGAGVSVALVTLRDVGLFEDPPAPQLFPPEDAQTRAPGLKMKLLGAPTDGPRPKTEQELRVNHVAWNGAGRVLATARNRFWNSYAFTGDDSLEVAAAQHLRVGEKALFWPPAESQAKRNPRDRVAVFELELLEVR